MDHRVSRCMPVIAVDILILFVVLVVVCGGDGGGVGGGVCDGVGGGGDSTCGLFFVVHASGTDSGT